MHIVALAGRHILEQRYVEETQITHGLFAIASQHYPLILVEMHLEVWGMMVRKWGKIQSV